MKESITQLESGDSQLWAVPSIHFRAAFAHEVNRLASEVRPDAIAVELGPDCAAFARDWICELGVSSNPQFAVRLPCLLGMIRPNRRIRADRKELAFQLQQFFGRELEELPPEILKQLLGYSGYSVLYLSPVDSIIEGIRCSCELDVPLYGVDMEATADAERPEILMRPPEPDTGHRFSLSEYVLKQENYAAQSRDSNVDARREQVMAARLKGILSKHRRVLFVCGLAHWTTLKRLLSAEAPAAVEPSPPPLDESPWQRMLVHPHLAIGYLDAIPAIAETYERNRPHATEARTVEATFDPQNLFLEKMRQVYDQRFRNSQAGDLTDKQRDLEVRDDFERLLNNLRILRQKTVPDMLLALQAARGVMSETFCQTLVEVLMEFPWAGPERFKELPILGPAPTDRGQEQRAEVIYPDGSRSRHFYIKGLPGRNGVDIQVPVPWQWDQEPEEKIVFGPGGGRKHCWTPTETLLTLLSLHSVQIANEHNERPKLERFQGSLYDGIDLKSTLRAYIRGDENVQVRVPSRSHARKARRIDESCYPFIWLFSPNEPKVDWQFSVDTLTSLRPDMQDLEKCDRIRRELGDYSVLAIVPSGPARIDQRLSTKDYRVERRQKYAQLNFNWLPAVKRTARWLEKTDFALNPVLDRSPAWSSLSRYYSQRHGLKLMDENWAASLVLMALPFATRAMTVVAPDGYQLPHNVYREATARGVEIRMIPVSFLPAESVKKISESVWIPALGRSEDEDLPIFPEHVLRHFGEPVDRYRKLYKSLLPEEWRA